MKQFDPASATTQDEKDTIMENWRHLKEHVRVADLKYGHDEISSTYLHGPQAGQRLGTLHFELMNGIKRV